MEKNMLLVVIWTERKQSPLEDEYDAADYAIAETDPPGTPKSH